MIACGHPINDELIARPHTLKFLSALKRAGGSLAITQNDSESLHLHSGKFKAVIPCLDFTTWPNVMPDQARTPIDNKIKEAIAAVGVLASESGATVIEATVLLQNMTCVATNRHVIMEYYHGHNIAEKLAIPKLAANFICKVGIPLAALGVTHTGNAPTSATFYFQNGAWIRTQLYAEDWPSVDGVFTAVENNAAPRMAPPEGFFEALDALSQFTRENETVFFRHDVLASDFDEGVGATYEVPGVPSLDHAAAPKYLALMQPHCLEMAFNPASIYFQSRDLRGLMSLKTVA